MKKITTRMCSGGAREEDVDLLKSVADQIAGVQFVHLAKRLLGQFKVLLLNSKMNLRQRQKSRLLLRQQGENTATETSLI